MAARRRFRYRFAMSITKTAFARKFASPNRATHALMSAAGGAAGGGVLGGGLGALTELSGTPDEMLGAAGRGALTGAVAGGVVGGVASPLLTRGVGARAAEHVAEMEARAERVRRSNAFHADFDANFDEASRHMDKAFADFPGFPQRPPRTGRNPRTPEAVPPVPSLEAAEHAARADALLGASAGGAATGAGVGLVGSMWPSIVAERDQKRELGIPTFARTTYQIAPKTAAYQAGYASVMEKLALSPNWVTQHTISGGLQRLRQDVGKGTSKGLRSVVQSQDRNRAAMVAAEEISPLRRTFDEALWKVRDAAPRRESTWTGPHTINDVGYWPG